MYDFNNVANDIFGEGTLSPVAPSTLSSDIEALFIKVVRKELKKQDKKSKKKEVKARQKLIKTIKKEADKKDSKKARKAKKSKSDLSELITKTVSVSIENGLPLLYKNIFDASSRKRGGDRHD